MTRNAAAERHRWSGWPGAFCLNCGIEDQVEIAIADGIYDPYTDAWTNADRKAQAETAMKECPASADVTYNNN